ncbi:gag-protease polyprotein, partial [Trifolium medium]|nr:gag-protease polyprotein [Trifolium medium]MCI05264.1 gag-protease polyprotein [Trifolium medium]
MLHKADDKLEEIIEKNVRKPRFTGLSYENVNKHRGYNPDLMYTQPKETQDTRMSRQRLPHFKQHQGTRYKGKPHPWVCHYCGRKGHIRPFCFKLYGYPNRPYQQKPEPLVTNTKKEWKPKDDEPKNEAVKEDNPKGSDVGLIAHTSLRASSRENWYFDSGCSRHMTGVERYLTDVKSYATSFVTFGDGAKGEIK